MGYGEPMKIGVFSDIHWSLGRVYRDIAKYMPECEFRYIHWASWSLKELYDVYNWCDVMIVNLVEVDMITKYVSPNKILFVSHGFEEHNRKELNPLYNYAMTSDSIRTLFPTNATVWLTPNGVDPTDFNYIDKSGVISKLGWCGNPHTWYKQANWVRDIAINTNTELSISSKNPCEDDFSKWQRVDYEEVRKWYSTIDLLIVASIPEAKYETGPLPAFEAIASGILVIGTPVGNFRHVPGPKFTSIEEAVSIIQQLKDNPASVRLLAKEQYDYVMQYFTYKSFAHKWKEALDSVLNNTRNKHS
jgi:glycosyltransferase involved in cell wall biosynthesis